MLFNRLKLYRLKSLIPILLVTFSISKEVNASTPLGQQIECDYRHFYSYAGISHRLIGIGVGGIMANTNIDPDFRTFWQEGIRNDFTNKVSTTINDYSKVANYPVAAPLYLVTMWLSTQSFTKLPTYGVGLWANHSLRTLLVGAPEQVVLTHLLGSGRPQTDQHDWHLFKQHRAVSGHAFYGAIPLINIAKQTTQPVLKFTFYGLSVLPGLARINSDKHYLSQVWLGWWLAFSAANAVWETDVVSKKPHKLSIQMAPIENGIYLGLQAKL